MNQTIIASSILSISFLLSAALISGNIDLKKKNIVNTDNGHVNLGKIYSERGLVDATLRFAKDESLVFSADDMSMGS